MKRVSFRRMLRIMLVLLAVSLVLPALAQAYTLEVDASTMDDWKRFFPEEQSAINTQYAGAVWMDKSVFKDQAFSAIGAPKQDQFHVALSAVAATKEIKGYSTIPTDTVLVLDVSGSMKGDKANALVPAANSAIDSLLKLNNHNRVGVLLFSGANSANASTKVLLPLDRYTGVTNSSGKTEYIEITGTRTQTIKVIENVKNSKNESMSQNSKEVSGSTYIQEALIKALNMYKSGADTVVPDGTFQAGQKYLPILVLMGDGSPTKATSDFTFSNTADAPNAGTGSEPDKGGDGMAFLTQLTASYVLNRLEDRYDRAGEGLFYTLGVGVSENENALSVLDPANSDVTDGLWNDYLQLTSGAVMNVSVTDTEYEYDRKNDRYLYKLKNVTVSPNSYARDPHYVDEAFFANDATDLVAGFEKIVEEIIIQSRYFATDLEGKDPDFSGYVTIEDRIGEFMEVKAVKGIMHGNVYHSGSTYASLLTKDHLGGIENPSELGLEYRDSICARLGITKEQAIALIDAAYHANQLYYNSDSDFGNSIGWYADASGAYLGFWNEGTTRQPANAKYKVRSYGYVGETSGSIARSDMMYMTVRVTTDIDTGAQWVNWNIPAALMPLITYEVALDGSNEQNANVISVTYRPEKPMQLVCEVGLKDSINPLTVAKAVGDLSPFKKNDGTYQFWSNYWDNWTYPDDHMAHQTTTAKFSPSLQNELYYYTAKSPMYEKTDDNTYQLLTTQPDDSVEYYHLRYYYQAGEQKAQSYYQPISNEVAQMAQQGSDGVYYIPQYTAYRQKAEYEFEKDQNITESIRYAQKPLVTSTGSESEMLTKLGNNGRLTMTPATGLMITKTIDVTPDPGTDTSFSFQIDLADENNHPLSGTYPTVLAAMGKSDGVNGNLAFFNGSATVNINAGQTLYLTGLPAGTQYAISEVSSNHDYKLLSVHVNGQAMQGTDAIGSITSLKLDDVHFVNTSVMPAALKVTKQVEHPFGSQYQVPSNVKFSAVVDLVYDGEPLANETVTVGQSSVTTDANGKLTLQIGAGQTVKLEGLPEGTSYLVTETDLPAGFEWAQNKSTGLEGVLDYTSDREAKLVNTYKPNPPSQSNTLLILKKTLTGRDWKSDDEFEFVSLLTRPNAQEDPREQQSVKATYDMQTLTGMMTASLFDEAGVWLVTMSEKVPQTPVPGITYDPASARFAVTVADEDMDGELEIVKVENKQNTNVTQNGSTYTVEMTFENQYAPTGSATVSLDVKKAKTADSHDFPLSGFDFGLYEAVDSSEPLITSTYTNADGIARFERLVFPARMIRQEPYVYYLREKKPANPIPNMSYSDEYYKVYVQVSDNGNGGVTAALTVKNADDSAITGTPVFSNKYTPEKAYVQFRGSKTLTGRILNSGEFAFELYEEGKTDPIQTVYNNETGGFLFAPVTFDNAGTYKYTIKEKSGSLGGVDYSRQVYEATVVVTDAGNGELHATRTITDGTSTVQNIQFTNTYDPQDTSVQLKARKTMKGKPLAAGDFTFTLSAKSGTDLAAQTKSNASDGTITFDAIQYDQAGVYRYTVEEVKGSSGGVTYDATKFDVTVTVMDDSNGKLHASVRYEVDGAQRDEMVFANSYAPAPYPLSFMASKQLIGGDNNLPQPMRKGVFACELVDLSNNCVIATASNERGSGMVERFVFNDAVTVTQPGTYRYRLREVNTNEAFVSYDQSYYDVEIVLSDDGNGHLVEESRKVTKNGQDVNSSDITFVNRFDPVVFEKILITKLIDNMPASGLALSGYQFQLADENGNVQIAETDEKGYALFRLAYDLDDVGKTYTYVLSEVNTALPHITYSEQRNIIKVTVRQNELSRALYVDTVLDGAPVDLLDVTFTNVFVPPAVSVPATGDRSGIEYAAVLLLLSALSLHLQKKKNPKTR